MGSLKIALYVLGGLAATAVLLAVLAVVGTYVAYFVVAMEGDRKAPFAVTCTQLSPPSRGGVRVRFEVANASRKDATWINFAMFAAGEEGRNLSDWGYALDLRVPARGSASKDVTVELPRDYRAVPVRRVVCNPINAVFADGSQESYGHQDNFP